MSLGIRNTAVDVPNEIFWGGDPSRIEILRNANSQIDSSVTIGSPVSGQPDTKYPAGLIVGRDSTTGKIEPFGADHTDGTQDIVGVLDRDYITRDELNNAFDPACSPVVCAPVKASALLIDGAAMVGHADEFEARAQLGRMGFRVDDDMQGVQAGVNTKYVSKSADYTVLDSDQGTTFIADTADVNFTLPTIKAGMKFTFIRSDDFELAVTSAAGSDIFVFNNTGASSVTITTAGQQIAATVEVEAVYIGSNLRWRAIVPGIGGTVAVTIA